MIYDRNKRNLITRINRLTILSDHLKIVKSKKFDINSYVDDPLYYINSKFDENQVHKNITNNECNTTACAMGYATIIPKFRKAGLSLQGFRYNRYSSTPSYRPPKGDHYDGFDASLKFFKLSIPQNFYIFCSEEYSSDRCSKYYVIKRINKVIKDSQAKLDLL